jgi:hypothetical protein
LHGAEPIQIDGEIGNFGLRECDRAGAYPLLLASLAAAVPVSLPYK